MTGVIYYTQVKEEYRGKNLAHMVGEKLLEEALFSEYGKELRFEPRAKGEFGKPFFTLEPKIHYNISHSGDYVVCLMADQPVGIDIQQHKEVNYEGILKRTGSGKRLEDILRSEDPQKAFFDEWVRLEAYIKWQWFTVLFDMGKINAQVFANAQQEYAWAAGDAQSEFSRLSLDEAETLFNSFKTMLPRNHEHWKGFFTNGSKENWRLH